MGTSELGAQCRQGAGARGQQPCDDEAVSHVQGGEVAALRVAVDLQAGGAAEIAEQLDPDAVRPCGAGLLGLAVAVGLAVLTSHVSQPPVGVPGEPVSAGEALAPAPATTVSRAAPDRSATRTTDAVTAPSRPPVAPPPRGSDDDDSDSSGSGTDGDEGSGGGAVAVAAATTERRRIAARIAPEAPTRSRARALLASNG